MSDYVDDRNSRPGVESKPSSAWRRCSVLEVADFTNGRPHEADISANGPAHLITLDSVSIDGYLKRNHKRVKIDDKSLSPHDLVTVLSDLAHGNLLGLTAEIPPVGTYVLNQRMGRLRVRSPNIPAFIRLQINAAQRHFRNAGQGTSQRHIYKRDFATLTIGIPSPEEQAIIASAIGDAEKLVATLELLIAKKEAVKHGIMQQLLTGQTRLPGFGGEWTERALGELAIVDPESLPSWTNPNEALDYISLEDVNRGRLLGWSRLTFNNAPSRARRVIREMDVLFGTVRPNLQSHMIYAGGLFRPVASTGFAVVRAMGGRADPRFLYDILMSNLAWVQIERIIAGSSYPAVTSGDVRRLRFEVPELREQVAIGAVLAECDAELDVLLKRLMKAKTVKQGMTQELLTGRTRLPVTETVA